MLRIISGGCNLHPLFVVCLLAHFKPQTPLICPFVSVLVAFLPFAVQLSTCHNLTRYKRNKTAFALCPLPPPTAAALLVSFAVAGLSPCALATLPPPTN